MSTMLMMSGQSSLSLGVNQIAASELPDLFPGISKRGNHLLFPLTLRNSDCSREHTQRITPTSTRGMCADSACPKKILVSKDNCTI